MSARSLFLHCHFVSQAQPALKYAAANWIRALKLPQNLGQRDQDGKVIGMCFILHVSTDAACSYRCCRWSRIIENQLTINMHVYSASWHTTCVADTPPHHNTHTVVVDPAAPLPGPHPLPPTCSLAELVAGSPLQAQVAAQAVMAACVSADGPDTATALTQRFGKHALWRAFELLSAQGLVRAATGPSKVVLPTQGLHEGFKVHACDVLCIRW